MTMPDVEDVTRDPPAVRQMVAAAAAAARRQRPANPRLTIQERRVPGPAGEPDVAVRLYTPSASVTTASAAGRPALLWMHGGAFMWGTAEQDDPFCERVVEQLGYVVVAVDDRLAPEHPYPAALEDCAAALHWLVGAAGELGIDRARVAVGGTSAGGCLAAALALQTRDRGGPRLAFQLLIVPTVDDRHETLSSQAIVDSRTVNRRLSQRAWSAYLGDAPGGDVPPYAAPARAADLSGLPPAYVGVAELDVYRDEGITYATRLMQSGTRAELHVFPGTIHGFEVIVPTAAVSRRALREQVAALAALAALGERMETAGTEKDALRGRS